MIKQDFKKTIPCYTAKKDTPQLITVPKMQYLMIDGYGDPNTSADYQDSIMSLYPLAYKLKFASKEQLDRDYVVMPLEALWWADDMTSFTSSRDKSKWDWTLMIMQADWITDDMFHAALQKVKVKDPPRLLDKVRLDSLEEGLCVQTLYIGSYDNEAQALDRVHNDFIPSNNLRMTGEHHEIYFSDFRKVAPEKLRTILRQPVVAN